MPEIQARRAQVIVPGGRRLHEYANLYICARNPMLFKLKGRHTVLCVLRVAPAVLDLPGVVIADQNAASDYVRFLPAPGGLARIDREQVFARSWKHPDDQVAEWRHKAAKCAELLVPDRVDPAHILGAYTSSAAGAQQLGTVAPGLTTVVDPDLFFS